MNTIRRDNDFFRCQPRDLAPLSLLHVFIVPVRYVCQATLMSAVPRVMIVTAPASPPWQRSPVTYFADLAAKRPGYAMPHETGPDRPFEAKSSSHQPPRTARSFRAPRRTRCAEDHSISLRPVGQFGSRHQSGGPRRLLWRLIQVVDEN